MEKLCKVELHTDFDLGVNIDLINPETYIRPPNAEIHPDDNALLQEDDVKSKSDTKRYQIQFLRFTAISKMKIIAGIYRSFS